MAAIHIKAGTQRIYTDEIGGKPNCLFGLGCFVPDAMTWDDEADAWRCDECSLKIIEWVRETKTGLR